MNRDKQPYLSIVIPVYNEERRVKNLTQIIPYLKKQKYSWEVIVVNDGSTDKTETKLEQLKKQLKDVKGFKHVGTSQTFDPNLNF